MTILQRLTRYGGMRAARRMSRSAPVIGGLIAVGTLATTVRRKGFLRGLLDTILTAIPFVGGVKSAVEVARGRDLIADRPAR